jgi:hypothetical protein
MSGVDKSGSAFFHQERSGAPIRLIGVKRESGAIRHSGGEANPELPPQLSAASPSSVCHWALRVKAREGEEG